MQDIYFDENYGKLYEKVEKGEACVFECSTENGTIINQYIKREIPIKLDDNTYYDIVTPYGYGGPYIKECINKEQLLKDYEEQFAKHCVDNNIVAEFVRFHPIYKNHEDFKIMYNATFNRCTLATNLELDNPVQDEFSKSCRKNIRQALNKGVTYRVTENPTNVDVFKDIYYSTMDRNNATEYYYFDDEYFNNILKYFPKNVLLVEAIYEEKTIACGLYFKVGTTIHIHLSGTLTEYLFLSPAYILRYATTLWGKENGYKLIHHGGGRTAAEDDSLYTFKKGFAQISRCEFYLGKKIWNSDIYDNLCKVKGISKEIDYFPAYRKEVEN